MGSGEEFLRWTPEEAQANPGLRSLVAGFEAAGDKPAARAAAHWLRESALLVPQESVTRLWLVDGAIQGFYALANGQVVLRSSHRKKMGFARTTQPAVILTWIAKAAGVEASAQPMIDDALAIALAVARLSAATAFALDPFDEETAEMWRRRQELGFRSAATDPDDKRPARLWIPLS